MKIQPIQNFVSFKTVSFQNEANAVVPVEKNKTVQQFVTVGAGVGAIVSGLLIHKNVKIHKVEKAIADTFAAELRRKLNIKLTTKN